ncbi:MAG TPA: hypothetical protein VLH39_02730 [Magnetospirillaceae bacterium]|nr:hypothetical protein [Magnetospirillaceae bacterium]
MSGIKRTLFIALSLCVFLAALGFPSLMLAARYTENLRRARSVFQPLKTAAAAAVLHAGPSDPAWRARALDTYADDQSILLVALHAPGPGILYLVPSSPPFLPMEPRLASVPLELAYPPWTVSRLSAVVGSSNGMPVTLELLYTLLRQRDVYEAIRVGLVLAAGWTALSLLFAAAEGLRRPAQPSFAAAGEAFGGPRGAPETSSFRAGHGLLDDDFELPAIPPLAEAGPDAAPRGLYSPESGLGWPEYLADRLGAELARAASFEQDLVLLMISHEGIPRDSFSYRALRDKLFEYFAFRDLAFEAGPASLAVIQPNADLNRALRMAGESLKKATETLREAGQPEVSRCLHLGLSSRSGRLVDAHRLIVEARSALEKARSEGDSRIVGFQPDPDRYRSFLASRG